jgi:uncharacterized protein YecE (DUF72 family)
MPWRVGCAGWNMPASAIPYIDRAGSHLERYARVFQCVEINSSFYRPHRTSTYERWAASVPATFRFSAKVPRAITHEARLRDTEEAVGAFASQVGGLGEKLGCLLVQLPPSLAFEARTAGAFLATLRRHTPVPVVMEPRHASWFTAAAVGVGQAHGVDWAWAHPSPAGVSHLHQRNAANLLYLRLHGAPRIYASAYDDAFLHDVKQRMLAARSEGLPVWCIFDNTAQGQAIPNARDLLRMLESTDSVTGRDCS